MIIQSVFRSLLLIEALEVALDHLLDAIAEMIVECVPAASNSSVRGLDGIDSHMSKLSGSQNDSSTRSSIFCRKPASVMAHFHSGCSEAGFRPELYQ